MSVDARRPWLVLAPSQRPGWLDVGGRWSRPFCVLVVLSLAVGLRVLFAYSGSSVRVGALAEILLLSFVMARVRAIRWHDLVSLTATLCMADVLFFVGPARWIWPAAGFSTLPMLRFVATPTVIGAECGQVVLALLLLAGLDPQLRTQLRGYVTPAGRGFVLRAAGAVLLLACALWSGRHLISDGTLAEFKVTVITTEVVDSPNCARPEPSITPANPALAGCVGPASQSQTKVQSGGGTGNG